jgi:hypothetical protein
VTAAASRAIGRLGDIDVLNRQGESEVEALPTSWANAALVQTREQVAHYDQQRWLRAIDDQDLRDEYRQMGHQLMGLLLQYVAADELNGTFIEEAKRIGRRYGMYGRRSGLSLTSILEATLFFRDILIESSLRIPETTYVKPEANLRILRRVNRIINTIQLSVTSYYESADPRPDDAGE